MKKISYKLDPDIPFDKIIVCPDAFLEANIAIAAEEAYDGKYTVEELGDE